MQTWFIKRMGSGIYRNTFQTRETGFEFKTSFGCKLAMGPGQIKDS